MRPLLVLALAVGVASAQEVRPRLVPQLGHQGGIGPVAFRADSRSVLTGGDDGTARLWDVETGAEVARLGHHGRDGVGEDEGYVEGVAAAAIRPDGRAVTVGADGSVRVWEVATGAEVVAFETAPFYEPVLSPDGARVAAQDEGLVAVWDVATGEQTTLLELPPRVYGPIVFAPDGRLLMVSAGLAVRVWDGDSGALLETIDGGVPAATSPRAVWVTPDGRRLVVADRTTGGHLLDLETGRVTDPPPYLDGLVDLAFSADGSRVAVYRDVEAGIDGALAPPPELRGRDWAEVWGWDSVVEVWEAEGGEPLLRLPLSSRVALSPDGRRLLAIAYAGAALWDVDGGALRAELGGRVRVPIAAAFADDGRQVVADGVWSLARGTWAPLVGPEAVGTAEALDRAGWRAVAPAAGRVLAVTDDGTAEVWPTDGGPALLTLPPSDAAAVLPVVALGPEGDRLAEARGDTLRVWDVAAAEAVVEVAVPDRFLRRVAFSADGTRLVTVGDAAAGEDRVVRVWEAATGAPLAAVRSTATYGLNVALSPDGARLATSTYDSTRVWNGRTGELVAALPGVPAWSAAPFSPDGTRLLLATSRPSDDETAPFEEVPTVWDVERGEPIAELAPLAPSRRFGTGRFSPDGRRLLTVAVVPGSHDQGPETGTAQLWDADTGALLHTVGDDVGAAAFSPDGAHVLTAGLDGTLQLWDAATGASVASLFAFRDGSWAVVDAEGRYDASNGGDVDGLVWAVEAPDGLEPVRLAQLKARYYDPGLLAKHVGFSEEPLRDVAVFRERGVALYPAVAVAEASPEAVTVRLDARGGGIGPVAVFVNETRVVEDARPADLDPAAETLTVAVDLRPFRRLFLPDTLNAVAVTAANAEGSLVSRRRTAEVFVPAARGTDEEAPADAPDYAPHLWAVLVGVGDYAGGALDLRFAGADAADVAEALGVVAPRLFGPERTHLTLLTTDPGGDGPPTRAAILDALAEAAARADARDVLLVYLAGHGVVHGGADGDFFFLTRDAATGDLADAAVREAVAVSAAELEARLAAVPALKRVLILDTCASGRVVEQLSARRDVPGAQVRSLDRLKDHTGTFVLAGSAADAVSYEASQYGQGLLTWSLLEGLRLAADADDNAVDVLAWFDHAQRRVPELARSIGGIQQPELVMPSGRGSYPVGRVLPEDQARIPLQTPRPVVLRASFQDEATFGDPLGLTRAVNEALRETSVRGDRPPLVYVDAEGYPEAFRLAGRYAVADGRVTVEARLVRGGAVAGSITTDGTDADVPALAAALVAAAEAALAAEE